MKLKDFKPLNAWSQLSEDNKQRVLNIQSLGENYANTLMRCTVSEIPWVMYNPLCSEFGIESTIGFWKLFNIKL